MSRQIGILFQMRKPPWRWCRVGFFHNNLANRLSEIQHSPRFSWGPQTTQPPSGDSQSLCQIETIYLVEIQINLNKGDHGSPGLRMTFSFSRWSLDEDLKLPRLSKAPAPKEEETLPPSSHPHIQLYLRPSGPRRPSETPSGNKSEPWPS
jgi:hypothetical protein